MRATLYCGDALTVLQTLPAASVQCCVTSPPYWGLRDYGVPGQLGLEPTPDAYAARLLDVFAAVHRVLRDDGTLWLNLGDCYCSIGHKKSGSGYGSTGLAGGKAQEHHPLKRENNAAASGAKHKDLVGIPWRVAFALQAAGWWLRSDIIWSKPNPMPESVTDRPTKAHEYVFLLSKSATYYYDAAAIAEDSTYANDDRKGRAAENHKSMPTAERNGIRPRKSVPRGGFNGKTEAMPGRNAFRAITQTRNARTVWEIATQPYPEAHFATFPEELARRCIVAGSRPTDTVLDPFGGSGTVAQVATGNGRAAISIDLNPQYVELARQRIGPMLVDVA